ncbi:hypothetical protein V1291_000063 [Nitrobacteraceae bacterium AZCC 1564]
MRKSGILRLSAATTAILIVSLVATALALPHIRWKKERLVLAAAFLVGTKYQITDGWCDEAAKDLKSVLSYFDIESEQMNMSLQYGGAHSALSVNLDGKSVYVDPYFGFAAIGSDGHLVGIDELLANLSDGKGVPASMRRILFFADDRYYQGWHSNKLYYSAEGSNMSLAFDIPKLKGRPKLNIGIANKSASDVNFEGALLGYTPYWHYLGSRYDATWTRSATATEDVIFEATTIEDVKPDNIDTDPAPSYIEGKRVGWRLAAGQTLTFNWGRVTGSQDVDYWTIKPDLQKTTIVLPTARN